MSTHAQPLPTLTIACSLPAPRTAAKLHRVPFSTLLYYKSSKAKLGTTKGPPTALTAAEEDLIVGYIAAMRKAQMATYKQDVLITAARLEEVSAIAANRQPRWRGGSDLGTWG